MIKKLLNKLLNPNTYNSDAFSKYLRKKGCIIGNNTYFFSPKNTWIDTDNLIFIEIGECCKITSGVKILAHDYSYSVLRKVYGEIPKKANKTIIGDNCFIGMNAIILMGSKIGNNCIIGAGSVVSGRIPDNEVWGGNPARFICTLEEYYRKCKNKFEEGAILTVNQYLERFNRIPNINEMQYFSTLFLNTKENIKRYEKMKFNGDNKKEVLNNLINIKNKYKNYNEFLEKNKLKKKEEKDEQY